MLHLAHLSHIGTLGRRGSNAIQPPDFFIPLTSSLALSRGVGSPTFTRNTTATVWGYDNSGNWTLLTIPSETPRFEGARWTGSAWTDTFPDGSKIPDAALKGYLVEGQRTNLLLQSDQFNNSAWTNYAIVTVSGILSLNRNYDAYLITSNGSNSGVSQVVTAVSNAPYTAAVIMRYTNTRWAKLQLSDMGVTHRARSWFDIKNGVKGSANTTGSGVVLSYGITSLGNGWYLCTMTATNPITTLYAYYPTVSDSDGSTASATSGASLCAWKPTLEQGLFLSSYSATTNTTTTRNADSLSYLSSLFSDTAGTAYVELTPLSWANVSGGILGDGSNRIIAPSYSYGAYAYDGTNTANGPSMSPSGKVKAAIRWGNGKMRVFANGFAANESNYDGAFSLSSLLIGNNFYGNIKNVKGWYNRILSDYQCQKMTA